MLEFFARTAMIDKDAILLTVTQAATQLARVPTPCSTPSLVRPSGAPSPRILTEVLRGFEE